MIPIESQSPPPIIIPLPEGAGGFMDWSPEERTSRPRSSRPGRQVSHGDSHIHTGVHSPSLHEHRGKGRPRYRSSLVGDYNGPDHLAVDIGFAETPQILESPVYVNDETPVQEALDGVLTSKEKKQFERTMGLNGKSGEVNRRGLKEIAQLNQHALESIGFGALGRDLRDTHVLEEARNAAKELVNSMSTLGDAGNGQVEEAVSRVLDGLKATHSDAWQLVGTGAALAGFALLKKRGKQGLAYLVLTSGLAFCGGGSTANNHEGAEALDSFVQTDTFGIQGTFLDNASVTAPDFGKLYGVKTDVAPNYTTLTTTLLDKLRSDYPQLSPTALSYVNLNDKQSGGALEFAIVGTNQTAATGEPLFVAAYVDGGNVRINTVVQKKNDRYQVTYSDGSTREETVTSYRLVEAINDKGELVLGDPLEVIIERDGVPYVIVLDPAGDGDAFIFIPAAVQDQTVLIGSAGHFGPHLAALKPVAGIPPTEVAPLELPATATIGPTEELASATPLPSETPEPIATPTLAPASDALQEFSQLNISFPERLQAESHEDGFKTRVALSEDLMKNTGITDLNIPQDQLDQIGKYILGVAMWGNRTANPKLSAFTQFTDLKVDGDKIVALSESVLTNEKSVTLKLSDGQRTIEGPVSSLHMAFVTIAESDRISEQLKSESASYIEKNFVNGSIKTRILFIVENNTITAVSAGNSSGIEMPFSGGAKYLMDFEAYRDPNFRNPTEKLVDLGAMMHFVIDVLIRLSPSQGTGGKAFGNFSGPIPGFLCSGTWDTNLAFNNNTYWRGEGGKLIGCDFAAIKLFSPKTP